MTRPDFPLADQPVRGALPRLRHVLLEQVRATGLALRWPATIAAALVALLTLLVGLVIVSRGVVVNLDPRPTLVPGALGALLPIAVWAREERFGAGFLWTLPVDRRQHAFARTFAGWVWLMGGLALVALWLLALTLVSGGRIASAEMLHVLAAPLPAAGPLDPAAVRTIRWAPGPLIWLAPFTAATGSYLLASALALGSRHPFRWVIGSLVAYLLASVASTGASASPGVAGRIASVLEERLRPLVHGPYGLDALLTARTESLNTTATLATGELIEVWVAVPDVAHWLTATLLWIGAGLLALWAAASRHRERRRA